MPTGRPLSKYPALKPLASPARADSKISLSRIADAELWSEVDLRPYQEAALSAWSWGTAVARRSPDWERQDAAALAACTVRG